MVNLSPSLNSFELALLAWGNTVSKGLEMINNNNEGKLYLQQIT